LKLLEDDTKKSVQPKEKEILILGSRGGVAMEEEGEKGTTAEEKSVTSASSYNAKSKYKGKGGLSSIETGRISLLGLIPVKILTSKQWDLRLDTQNLNNRLSDNAVRNCNRLFWINNEHSEAFRVWNIGKELEFSFSREDDVVIDRLQAMKMRDKSTARRESISRVKNSLSNDEAN